MSEKSDSSDTTVALNVRLMPREQTEQPVLANYSAVSLAQGLAYMEFGFIEPALLSSVGRAARAGKPTPKGVQGRLVSRVALPLDALVRLEQQLRQVVVGLQGGRATKREDVKG
jgi:hypothetical protein